MRLHYTRSFLSALFALISLVAVPSFGQNKNYDVFIDEVDSLLVLEIVPDGPGAAVAVIQNGKVIYRRNFGLASLEHKTPITNETVFNLASVSKQFTALAVLLLEQDKELSLDDDIHKYFPELPAYDATVTLRNLMHHTSGLWEYSTMFRYYGGRHPADYTSIKDILDLLTGQDQLLFTPGSKWVYCNSNYALLGELVARVTGESLAAWTRRNIFDPLQMERTLFLENCFQVIPNAAGGYYKRNDVYYRDPRNSDVSGPSYLYSTVDDMVLWLDNFRQHKVGGDSTVERMFQKSKFNDGSENLYGYGLGIDERDGKRAVNHSGQTGSFISRLIYVPADELGIVILSNNRRVRAESLGDRILDLFYQSDKAEETVAQDSEPEPFIAVDSAGMEGLGGAYLIEDSGEKLFLCRLGSGVYGIVDNYASDFFRPVSDSQLTNRLRNAFVSIYEEADHKAGRLRLDLKKSGRTLWASLIEPPVIDTEQLVLDYAGTYYSEALDIAYRVDVADGTLIIRHPRYSDRSLQLADKDEFIGGVGIVRFSRNDHGSVSSLAVSDEDTNFKPLVFRRVQ